MTEVVSESPEVTVLLVDDNPQNLKVLYETLKDKGYRLLIANEGEKALDLAHRHQPEVILLDIMMPEMDGYEVCRRLKADPETADCAIVFLSALDDLQAKVKGFDLGGADYIAKPFQSQEVIARVRTHARVIRLERELQARNRELQGDQTRILNSISEGIYGLDEQGVIEFANPAAAMIVGAPVEELVGRNFFELHFATGAENPDSLPVQATCRQGIPENQRNIRLLRADGQGFPAEYRSTPKQEDGELRGAVVVFRDITAELAKEQALQEAQALVQEQRDQLAHTSRLTTMGEMAAGFAHEVNQPLTAITNYARVAKRMMARDEPDLDLLRQTLDKMEAQSHRASEIIRRIRRFMKKPAAGKEILAVPVLLEDTRQFAEVDMRNNDGGIEVVIEDGLPDVLADPIQVQQVALNLIRNALEATRSAGSSVPVRVSAGRAGEGFVKIEVRDHGVGLPEDAEEKLFHPFYTTKDEGMGIGLATCRSLIQAQGGEIGFERPEDGGACFYFTLPVAGREVESPASPEA
ncbi:ATP-binding response regulator [Marinobacter lutaoensis]|jgi:PAS domain S-box-containing protein|uniref:ATP-binding response regulator n=1 Tax=Marinobacter lutaoensis TaxID=135739 RepID=UPI0015939CB5|nr:response regulator [Marinobacter lutaoensis]NVD36872.1 response regulator [Marinobacter lutaoensis]